MSCIARVYYCFHKIIIILIHGFCSKKLNYNGLHIVKKIKLQDKNSNYHFELKLFEAVTMKLFLKRPATRN